MYDLFVRYEVSTIVEIFSFWDRINSWCSNYNCDSVRSIFDFLDGMTTFFYEVPELKKVSWGITRYSQFSKANDVNIVGFCTSNS